MSPQTPSTTVPKTEPNIWRGIGGVAGDNSSTSGTNQSNAQQSMPETELESEERLAEIFKSLDRDGNGRIDIQELTSSLKGSGMPHQYAEVKAVNVVVNSECFEKCEKKIKMKIKTKSTERK